MRKKENKVVHAGDIAEVIEVLKLALNLLVLTYNQLDSDQNRDDEIKKSTNSDF